MTVNHSSLVRLGSHSKRVLRYTGTSIAALIAVLSIAHYPSTYDEKSVGNPFLDRDDYQTFYRKLYAPSENSANQSAEQKPPDNPPLKPYWYVAPVTEFVRRYGLQNAHVLEVGAGSGKLQGVLADYTGLDISAEAARFFKKPFVRASATNIPFKDNEFDAAWTINVLEHVPKPEQALSEMRRVLKDKGILYLQAAWQCRTWLADGYEVRPYSDFGIAGKLVKASIPLRDSIAYRSLYTFPIRAVRLAEVILTGNPSTFRYNALVPNYKIAWQADSDALNSMDPYEAILWFTSRGDEVLSYEGAIHPFFIRSGTIVIRVNKPSP